MKKLFIKPDNIERDAFIKKLETELSVKLVSENEEDTVNGHVNTYEKEGKLYVVVELYDESEPANYVEGVYNGTPYHSGHKSNFVKVDTPEEKLEMIQSRLLSSQKKV